MKTNRSAFKTVWTYMVGILFVNLTLVASEGLASMESTGAAHTGPPPEMTTEQKECLEKNGFPKPSSGERPDFEKMGSVFEKCGIKHGPMPGPKPDQSQRESDEKAPSVGDKPKVLVDQKIGSIDSRTDEYIADLKILKNKEKSYIRLQGSIPKACASKLELSYRCYQTSNSVFFSFQELEKDALKCLESKKADCRLGNSKSCVSLTELESTAREQYKVRLTQTDSDEKCSALILDNVKVEIAFVKKQVGPQEQQQGYLEAEAGICVQCESDSLIEPPPQKLKKQARTINRKMRQARPPESSEDEDLDDLNLEDARDSVAGFPGQRNNEAVGGMMMNPMVMNPMMGGNSMMGMSPYMMSGMNPYAMSGMGPMMGGNSMMGMSPYMMSGMGSMMGGNSMMGMSPYMMSGMNPYAMSGMNPYAMSGVNSMMGASMPYFYGNPTVTQLPFVGF